jgi:hypothetical protein
MVHLREIVRMEEKRFIRFPNKMPERERERGRERERFEKVIIKEN